MTSFRKEPVCAETAQLKKRIVELAQERNELNDEVHLLRGELQEAWDDAAFYKKLSVQLQARVARLTPKKKAKKKAKRR
jgi:hypothetical protein